MLLFKEFGLPYLSIAIVIIYSGILIYTIIKILLDTHSTAKTLAYILLVFLIPVFGSIFYFTFGINYRHREDTRKRQASNKAISEVFNKHIPNPTTTLLEKYPEVAKTYGNLIDFIFYLNDENLFENECDLLINGEEKFPEVLKTLAQAKYFIHMEYYAWENDKRGNEIKEILLKKHAEGVKIRVIYDDYASRGIKKNIVREMKSAGIDVFPIIRVKLNRFASRLNHRDHRKVIIIDGHTGYIGGINISDRYDNTIQTGLYWRDTHVKIIGNSVLNLQRHFIVNWNACQPIPLHFDDILFPHSKFEPKITDLAQIVAGGPLYPFSNIMLTYAKIFTLARKKLYISNPYFIPSDSILAALTQAAISGVDVRLLLPEKSDSKVVGAASKFYYNEMLNAGVKIFLYKKGFIHAKTVVVDDNLSVVGTANLDIRSFDLNFEIMSVIYGRHMANQLHQAFSDDLVDAGEVTLQEWNKQSNIRKLKYAIARLISHFL